MSDNYDDDFDSSSTNTNSNPKLTTCTQHRVSITECQITKPSKDDEAVSANTTKSVFPNDTHIDNGTNNIIHSCNNSANLNPTVSVLPTNEMTKSVEGEVSDLPSLPNTITTIGDGCAALNVSGITATQTIMEVANSTTQLKQQNPSSSMEMEKGNHINDEETEVLKQAISTIEQYMNKDKDKIQPTVEGGPCQIDKAHITRQKKSLWSVGGAVYRFDMTSSVAPYGPAVRKAVVSKSKVRGPDTSLSDTAVSQRNERMAIERAYINILKGKLPGIINASYGHDITGYSNVKEMRADKKVHSRTDASVTTSPQGDLGANPPGSTLPIPEKDDDNGCGATLVPSAGNSHSNSMTMRLPVFPDDFSPPQSIFSAAALNDVDYINKVVENFLSSEKKEENKIYTKQPESTNTNTKQVDDKDCVEIVSSLSKRPLPTSAREKLWDYVNSAGYISTSNANKPAVHQSYGLKKKGGIFVIGHGGKATPLQLAAACGSSGAVKALLQAGAVDEAWPGPARFGSQRGEGKYASPYATCLPRPSVIAECNGFESMKLIFDVYSQFKPKKIKRRVIEDDKDE